MAVSEALSCDKNRLLVEFSNFKKNGSFYVFFSDHMWNDFTEICFLLGIWKSFLFKIHLDYFKMGFW